jgi:hypothetical protein
LEEYQEELQEDERQTKAFLKPSFSFAVETDNSLIEWEKKVVDLIGEFNNANERHVRGTGSSASD